MKRNPPFIAVILFLAAAALSARLSIVWPYVENWPYTGLLYCALFLLLTVIVIVKLRNYLIEPESKISVAKIAASFLLYFLGASAFWSFSLRFLTEPQMAISFERAIVLNKYRSSNHNYPGIFVQYSNGTTLNLDMPGQDHFWHLVRNGSIVSKQCGKKVFFADKE